MHFRRHGNFKEFKESGKPRILPDRKNDKKQSYFFTEKAAFFSYSRLSEGKMNICWVVVFDGGGELRGNLGIVRL